MGKGKNKGNRKGKNKFVPYFDQFDSSKNIAKPIDEEDPKDNKFVDYTPEINIQTNSMKDEKVTIRAKQPKEIEKDKKEIDDIINHISNLQHQSAGEFIKAIIKNTDSLSTIIHDAFKGYDVPMIQKIFDIFCDLRLCNVRGIEAVTDIKEMFYYGELFLPLEAIVRKEIEKTITVIDFITTMAHFGVNPNPYLEIITHIFDDVYRYSERMKKARAEYSKLTDYTGSTVTKLNVFPEFNKISDTQNYKLAVRNKHKEGYSNFDEFLDFVRKMNQEDFLIELRKAIRELREGRLDDRDLYLYKNVHISDFIDDETDLEIDSDCFLKFEPRFVDPRRGANLQSIAKSGRFQYNSLLIIAEDPNCQNIKALALSKARVMSKDNEAHFVDLIDNRHLIPVTVQKGKIEAGKRYYMFESPNMWSSNAALQFALLSKSLNNFPLELIKPVVKHDFRIDPHDPIETNFDSIFCNQEDYIKCAVYSALDPVGRQNFSNFTIYEIIRYYDRIKSSLPKNVILRTIRSMSNEEKDKKLRVDHQQLEALIHAFQYPLTLVNGDPGTGKTHLAREIIHQYLSEGRERPIVILTQTNHALDALLESVLQYTGSNFVRHGGRLRSENSIIRMNQVTRGSMHEELKAQNYNTISKNYRQTLYNEQYISMLESQFMELYNKVAKMDINEFPNTCGSISEQFIRITDPLFDFVPIIAPLFQTTIDISIRREEVLMMWFRGANYRKAVQDYIRAERKFTSRVIWTKIVKPLQFTRADVNEVNDAAVKVVQLKKEGDNNEDDEDEREDDIAFNAGRFIGGGGNRTKVDEPWEFPSLRSLKITKVFREAIAKDDMSPQNQLLFFLKKIAERLSVLKEDQHKQRLAIEVEREEAEVNAVGQLYKKRKLIAITATVAAVYAKALEKCKPEMMIIEEAGELTEAGFLSVVPRTVSHLVMIGDFNQLRPKVSFQLTKDPYNYDISTHERLVVAATNYQKYYPYAPKQLFSLTIQRRMHPVLADLLRNVFFNREGDLEYKDVPANSQMGMAGGIKSRLQLVLHNYKQDTGRGTRSYSNENEGWLAVDIAVLLLHRGYRPSDITIVALYRGQMFRIQNFINRRKQNMIQRSAKNKRIYNPFNDPSNDKIRVVCLDNFQGEENKVIIVSTTRSDKLGFLSARQRVLVTLSRAREMMFVLGNKDVLMNTADPKNLFWPKVVEQAKKQEGASVSIEIPGNGNWGIEIQKSKEPKDGTFLINTEKDLERYMFGTSTKACGKIKKCGHACTHPEHFGKCEDFPCMELCNRKCAYGHVCGEVSHSLCSECEKAGKCPECTYLTPSILKCGHKGHIRCCDKAHICPEICEKTASCGHKCSLRCLHGGVCKCNVTNEKLCSVCKKMIKYRCGQKPICQNQCSAILPCGHQCPGKCSECSENESHPRCSVKGCDGKAKPKLEIQKPPTPRRQKDGKNAAENFKALFAGGASRQVTKSDDDSDDDI